MIVENMPSLSSYLILAAASSVAVPLGYSAEKQPVVVTQIFNRPHPELADKVVIVQRIEIIPGGSAPAHRHPGMVTGYVESGTLEFQVEGEPLLLLKKGDTFFEKPGSHHLVARNPDKTQKTVVIAFVINPKDTPVSEPLHGHP